MLALWVATWASVAGEARAQGACTDPDPCLTAGKSIWLGDQIGRASCRERVYACV